MDDVEGKQQEGMEQEASVDDQGRDPIFLSGGGDSETGGDTTGQDTWAIGVQLFAFQNIEIFLACAGLYLKPWPCCIPM